jgi:hypothetical protein
MAALIPLVVKKVDSSCCGVELPNLLQLRVGLMLRAIDVSSCDTNHEEPRLEIGNAGAKAIPNQA